MTVEVSDATAEQKRATDLVLGAMENISSIARDNRITVGEMSRASDHLSGQAEKLTGMISVFRSSGARGGPVRQARPRPDHVPAPALRTAVPALTGR